MIHFIGLVLTGRVQIESDDLWGNREVFWKVWNLALHLQKATPVFPVSRLWYQLLRPNFLIPVLDTGRVLTTCPSACSPPQPVDPESFIYLLPEKSEPVPPDLPHLFQVHPWTPACLTLSSRPPKADAGIFIFLLTDSSWLTILSIDRSAMSSELSKMRNRRNTGCRQNHFYIKKQT